MFNSGWQPAVVDWSRAKEVYEKRLSMKFSKQSELQTIIESVEDAAKSSVIKSGELCWIASVQIEHPLKSHPYENVKIAYVWRHEAQSYIYVILEALHPLVSEKDVIEMSLKFGVDYGTAIK